MTASELWSCVRGLTPRSAEIPGLADRLAIGVAEIERRWPEAPSLDAFAGYLAARLEQQHDLATSIERLRVDDLFLAWWSGTGDPAGIAAFEATYSADLGRVLQRFQRLPSDELHQLLRIKLFVGTRAAPPRIHAYSGFGFLQNWFRVTAARAFLDVARTHQEQEYADELDQDELERLVPVSGDPRDAQQRAEVAAALRHAFAAAVTALSPRERTFLRLVSVDRLTLDQVAATYQVHRATVARTLAAARERLLRDTRAGVIAALGIAPDHIASAIGQLDSRLELSLSRVLREPA